MTYFYVDDGLHSHPKALAAGPEAMGLWVLAGSYCGRYLTEGFVPETFLRQFPRWRTLARKLVEVGLWMGEKHDEFGPGFRFHEWEKVNRKTKAEIEADQAANRARVRKHREKIAAERDSGNGITNGTQSSPVQSTSPKNQTSQSSNRLVGGGTDDGSSPVDNPVDYVAALEETAERLGVDKLQAGVVVDVILGRKGTPPQSIRRYVKGAITRQIHEWENWKHTGDLPE